MRTGHRRVILINSLHQFCNKKGNNNGLFYSTSLLAIEHIYHGEITFFPPFLTAMKDPNDTKEMIHEIMTVGVSMAVLLLVVWIGMVVMSEIAEHRKVVPNV